MRVFIYSPDDTGGGGDKKKSKLPLEGKPVDPNAAPIALYEPKDVTVPKKIKLIDNRQINPATGKPYKTKGTKGVSVDPEDVKAIIMHAKAAGIDPQDALAIALQETNLGLSDKNYGHALNVQLPDNSLEGVDPNQYGAVFLAHMVKEKMNYGRELMKKGIIPEGEDYLYQAYNGYGKLTPNTERVGNKKGQQGVYEKPQTSWYEIPVTNENPLDLKKNPAYGKIVRQLRDEIIKNNPEIQQLIKDTPAFQSKKGGSAAPTSYVPLNPQQRQDWNKFLDHLDATGQKDGLTDINAATAALTNYKSANPESSVNADMIPFVQYEHEQLRNGDTFAGMSPEQLQVVRNGLSPGYMNRDISKVDGWMGPKTAMQYYPTAMVHADDGSVQDFGTDIEAYANSQLG